MAWQEQDADGNRQGITIAEFGGLGGPGFGSCPSPADQAAPRRHRRVRALGRQDLGQGHLDAGNAAARRRRHHRLQRRGARHHSSSATTNQRSGLTRRTSANATHRNGHEPRSGRGLHRRGALARRTEDERRLRAAGRTATHAERRYRGAEAQACRPRSTRRASCQTDSVTVTSDTANAQLFFTTGDTPVIDGGLPSGRREAHHRADRPSRSRRCTCWAIDRAGNFDVAQGDFARRPRSSRTSRRPDRDRRPGAGDAEVDVDRRDDHRLRRAALRRRGTGRNASARHPDKTLTVTGLTADKAYTFTVKAQDPRGYGAESAEVGAVHADPGGPTGSRSARRSGRSVTSTSRAPPPSSARRSASAPARPPARSSAARSSPPAPRPGHRRHLRHPPAQRRSGHAQPRPDLGDLNRRQHRRTVHRGQRVTLPPPSAADQRRPAMGMGGPPRS